MQPMQTPMDQTMQNQSNRQYGYKPKFYNNAAQKRDKSNSNCQACGLLGHWAGDMVCRINGVVAPPNTKAITHETDVLAQFNALTN